MTGIMGHVVVYGFVGDNGACCENVALWVIMGHAVVYGFVGVSLHLYHCVHPTYRDIFNNAVSCLLIICSRPTAHVCHRDWLFAQEVCQFGASGLKAQIPVSLLDISTQYPRVRLAHQWQVYIRCNSDSWPFGMHHPLPTSQSPGVEGFMLKPPHSRLYYKLLVFVSGIMV